MPGCVMLACIMPTCMMPGCVLVCCLIPACIMGLQGSAFSIRVFSYFRRIRQRGGDGEKFGLFYYV
jgi:hypothetical protein